MTTKQFARAQYRDRRDEEAMALRLHGPELITCPWWNPARWIVAVLWFVVCAAERVYCGTHP